MSELRGGQLCISPSPLLGAMMSVDETLMCSFQILKPADKKKFPYGGLNAGRPVTPPRGATVQKAKGKKWNNSMIILRNNEWLNLKRILLRSDFSLIYSSLFKIFFYSDENWTLLIYFCILISICESISLTRSNIYTKSFSVNSKLLNFCHLLNRS